MINDIKNDMENLFNPLDKIIEKFKMEIKKLENNSENKPGELLMLKNGLDESLSANKIIYDVWENLMYLEDKSDMEKLNFYSDVIDIDEDLRDDNE